LQQLQNMQKVLRDAPNWDAIPEYAKEQIELLKDINASMTKDGKRRTISAKKLTAVVKELGVVK
ncbi:hypothetical protein, partial [Pseudomonas syringae]